MNKSLIAFALVTLAFAPALEAQGISFIGHMAFADEQVREISESGWNGVPYGQGTLLGLDISGQRLGIGMTAYAPGDFTTDVEEIMIRGIGFTGEVNYFLRLPFKLSPYVGGVVAFATLDEEEGFLFREFDGFGIGEVGWQAGLRWKPIPILGLDVRTRTLRGEYATGSEGSADRQWLVGLTLF